MIDRAAAVTASLNEAWTANCWPSALVFPSRCATRCSISAPTLRPQTPTTKHHTRRTNRAPHRQHGRPCNFGEGGRLRMCRVCGDGFRGRLWGCGCHRLFWSSYGCEDALGGSKVPKVPCAHSWACWASSRALSPASRGRAVPRHRPRARGRGQGGRNRCRMGRRGRGFRVLGGWPP